MTQILINTYNRPAELLALLSQLDTQPLKVAINDDGSDLDIVFPPYNHLEIVYHKQNGNHGKELYWKTCTNLFKMVDKSYNRFIMLPDDAILIDGFLGQAFSQWEAIKHRAIALNILLLKNFMSPNWTGKVPVQMNINKFDFWLTGWIDGCFISDLRLFEKLEYYIDSFSRNRWKRNPLWGSGVGQNMTMRLTNYGLYHTSKSLVYFDDPIASKMNPLARIKSPTIALL